MHKNKTQQFARFYLKDIKTKNPKYNDEKSDLEDLSFSSSN
tara:strand:+ start:1113 stop:1235 length:123 start_codon:yes stop_codon:yes gene_type:complete